MKFNFFAAATIIATLTTSCGTTGVYVEAFAPEESALNLIKITDESSNSVLAGTTGNIQAAKSAYGGLGASLLWGIRGTAGSYGSDYGRSTMGVLPSTVCAIPTSVEVKSGMLTF